MYSYCFILLKRIPLKAKYVLAPLALSIALFLKRTPLYLKLFYPKEATKTGDVQVSLEITNYVHLLNNFKRVFYALKHGYTFGNFFGYEQYMLFPV